MQHYEDYDYSKPASFAIWGKMWPFIKKNKKSLWITVIFMISCALIDILVPLLLGYAVDNFITKQISENMWWFVAVTVCVFVIQGINVYIFVRTALAIEVRISRDLRRAVFVHLQKLSLSYYNVTPVGYMMARAMSDTTRIGEMVAWGLVDLSWGICYIIGVFISMFILNWRLAIIVAVTIPALSFLTWWFQTRILRINRIVRKINSKMTGAMNEGIMGSRTTKILVIEDRVGEEFSLVTGSLKKNATRIALLRAIFGPLVMFIGTLAAAAVLQRGGMEVIGGGILLGSLATFLNYAAGIFEPIQHISRVISDFVSTQANIERVTGLLEKEPSIVDTPEVIAKYGDNMTPKRENWEPLTGNIEFDNVTFSYPESSEIILENFNLKISAGSYVAIVGETGAGKSTLVNLVCRFFEPTAGRILIDGKDYKKRSQLWLHSSIGYVLQDPHLFSGTVRENIRYGRLDASDSEVEQAARLVSADKVIAKLDKGMDSEVGEGGDRLSTGEKQIISFARAVLADPRIFVLDEATSSVDTETELLIQNAITHMLKNRTSFVIAHRLSTIRSADIILVVRGGKIIERGTHNELIKLKGYYYELYTRQFEEDIERSVMKSARQKK